MHVRSGRRLCHGALFLATAGSLPAAAEPSETMQTAMLRVHNAARAEVRAAPLVWDSALAGEALAWARQLARESRMRHSGRRGHGENLWAGTRGMFRHAQMAQAWVEEKRFFVNRPAVDFSTTGNWADVGHYTQVIWSTTTRIGCGIASDRRLDYLVCRYTGPGNIVGQRAIPVR